MIGRGWLPFFGLMALVLVLALPVLTYPLGRDQGEFATIGRGILDGKAPYIDLWNPKPPAVFYTYAGAMALFGRTAAALRAIDLLIVPVVCAALYWLGWRISTRRVGFFAALLFATFYFTETFWTLTQNDGIVLLPMTLAVLCLFKTLDHPDSWQGAGWAFGAGVGSAYAVWFKYPFALFGLMLVAGYLVSLPPARQRVRDALVFSLGAALILLGGAAHMMAIGAWDALIESARVTSQYTALTFNPQDFGELMVTALGFRWQHWGVLWVLAGLWPLLWRTGDSRRSGWYVIGLWLMAGLAIMLVQAKGYDYHWLPMLPPLALLGADTLDRMIGMAGRRGWVRRSEIPVTLIITLIFLALLGTATWSRNWLYLSGREDQLTYHSRFQAGEFIAGESLMVAEYLRERVAPGDSLYIFGFRPEVYYLSQLNPATRFIFQFPLVADWYPAAWREENVEILWAALPPYVLVLQIDYMPWVTGSDEDSITLLQEYNELRDWLAFNYERDAQIGNFFIWRRTT